MVLVLESMQKAPLQRQRAVKIVSWLLIKIVAYSGFVAAYYFLVLLFLAHWLKHMFDVHRSIYALITLPLIIAQAALLDLVVSWLRKLGGKEK